jgi:hypothetical protein
LDDLAAGRIEAAYARTSAGFQTNHGPESLYQLLNQNPDLDALYRRDETVITVRPCAIDTDLPSRQVFIKNDVLFVGTKLVAEGNQWKVSTCILQTTRVDNAARRRGLAGTD